MLSSNVFFDDTGSFTLEFRYENNNAIKQVLNQGVDDRIDIGSVVLASACSVSGVVVPPQQCYIRVRGLYRLAQTDSTGRYTINDLPADPLTINVLPVSTAYASCEKLIDLTSLTAKALDTIHLTSFLDESYSQWAHVKDLYLNTTASGAGIETDLVNFPLLVRLTKATVSFTDMRIDGGDVRFAKNNGQKLPFEIEFWDTQAGTAAVWVLLDTLFGNNDSQTIKIFWGNQEAPAFNQGSEVFAGTNGFDGVWHMRDTSILVESSSNSYSGNFHEAAYTNGQVGMAALFVRNNFGILPAATLDKIDSIVAISFWQNAISDSNPSHSRVIQACDRNGKPVMNIAVATQSQHVLWETVSSQGTQDRISEPIAKELYAGVWSYWTFEKNFRLGTMTIYRNGMVWSQASGMILPVDPITSVMLGNSLDLTHCYKGAIDEFRVESSRRPVAWWKACYENQRSDQHLIRY